MRQTTYFYADSQTVGSNPQAFRTKIDLAKGIYSLKMEWVSGTARIIGVEAYDSSRKEIMIRNLGVSGIRSGAKTDPYTASGLLFDTLNGRSYERRNMQKFLAPDLTVLEAGIINDILNTYGAVSKANTKLLIQDAKTTGDCIFFLPGPLDGATGDLANQAAYIQAAIEACLEENIPYINPRVVDGWKSYAEANAAGNMSDGLHDSWLGYDRKADMAFAALQAMATRA